MGKSVKRRPLKKRSTGKMICIRTEGENMEPEYFNGLISQLRIPRSLVDCKFAGGSDPKTVVTALIKEKKKNKEAAKKGYPLIDEFWAVFDTEAGRPGLGDAIKLASSRGFNCAISAPSFEYWILLHYKKTARPFCSCSEIERALKRLVRGGYSKSGYDVVDVLDRLSEAKGNIKQLRREFVDHSLYDLPNTNVDELVGVIEGACADKG